MEYVLGGLLFGMGVGWLYSAFVLQPRYEAPTLPTQPVNQGLLGSTDYDLHQIAMASAQLEMQALNASLGTGPALDFSKV